MLLVVFILGLANKVSSLFLFGDKNCPCMQVQVQIQMLKFDFNESNAWTHAPMDGSFWMIIYMFILIDWCTLGYYWMSCHLYLHIKRFFIFHSCLKFADYMDIYFPNDEARALKSLSDIPKRVVCKINNVHKGNKGEHDGLIGLCFT